MMYHLITIIDLEDNFFIYKERMKICARENLMYWEDNDFEKNILFYVTFTSFGQNVSHNSLVYFDVVDSITL